MSRPQRAACIWTVPTKVQSRPGACLNRTSKPTLSAATVTVPDISWTVCPNTVRNDPRAVTRAVAFEILSGTVTSYYPVIASAPNPDAATLFIVASPTAWSALRGPVMRPFVETTPVASQPVSC